MSDITTVVGALVVLAAAVPGGVAAAPVAAPGGAAAVLRRKALIMLHDVIACAAVQRACASLDIDVLVVSTPLKGFNAWPFKAEVTLAEVQKYLRYVADTYDIVVASVSHCAFVRALRNAGYSRPILAVKEKTATLSAARKEGNDIAHTVGFTNLMEKPTSNTALKMAMSAVDKPGISVTQVAGTRALIMSAEDLTTFPFSAAFMRLFMWQKSVATPLEGFAEWRAERTKKCIWAAEHAANRLALYPGADNRSAAKRAAKRAAAAVEATMPSPEAMEVAMSFCATAYGPAPKLVAEVQKYLRYAADMYRVVVAPVSQSTFVRALRNVGYSHDIVGVAETSASRVVAMKAGADIVRAIGFTDMIDTPTPAIALESIRKAFGEPAGGAGAM